jgi:hypothetical protein
LTKIPIGHQGWYSQNFLGQSYDNFFGAGALTTKIILGGEKE